MSKSSLPRRILGGALLVVVLVGGVLLHPHVFIMIFAFALALMTEEYYRMSFGRNEYVSERVAVCTLEMAVFAYVPLCIMYGWDFKYLLVALPLLLLIYICMLVKQAGNVQVLKVQDLSFPLVYLLPSFVISSRIMFNQNGEYSPWLFIALMCMLWMNDIGGYAFGMAFGQKEGSRKIAPVLSPKKSVAGVFGSLVFTLISSAVLCFCFNLGLQIWHWCVISVIVVVFGIFGDLFESLLKRHYGVKDSGTIVIGHGGLLDRFDAVVFALPVITVFLLLAGVI